MHKVYLIQSEVDKSIYIGYCNDIEIRLKQHNAGKTKSIKSKIPYRLIYYEAFLDKTDARKRELSLKRQGMQREFVLNNLKNSLL